MAEIDPTLIHGLGDLQLYQLHHYTAQVLSSRGIPPCHCSDYSVQGVSQSLAPTLPPSGRSSLQSNSVYSGETLLQYPYDAHDPQSIQHHRPLVSSEYKGLQTIPGVSQCDIIDPALLQGSVQGKNSATRISKRKTKTPSAQEDTSAAPSFFCTFCLESGLVTTLKTFKTKNDWKRHEEEFHETEYEWRCRIVPCLEVFAREQDLEKHCLKDHKCKEMPPNQGIELPEKQVYACGFINCSSRYDNWKDRLNHVAYHMKRGEKEWDYSWRMRNLLKNPDIAESWKEVKASWREKFGDFGELKWDPKTTRNLVLQLEVGNFEIGLRELLELIFSAGHPNHPLARGSRTPQTQAHLPPAFSVQRFPDSIPESNFESEWNALETFEAPINSNSIAPSQARLSIFMGEAPSIENMDDPDSQQVTWQSVLTENTVHNATRPLPTTPHAEGLGPDFDTARQTPGRSLARKSKSKGLLRSRTSQNFSLSSMYSHPDIPPNFHMPRS